MKKYIPGLFTLIVMALPLHAQEIEKLSWMTGVWTQKSDSKRAIVTLAGDDRIPLFEN